MAYFSDTRGEGLPPEKFGNLIRSDFWFRDGNVVLVTGSAAFKVHRGQLERQSEVFSDLFSIPQPQEQELVDGCCCVRLSDAPADMFYFLGALYDGLYFKKPRSSDFPALAAVLRLSTKYLVEHLRQRCIIRLEADWPATLTGWDARERKATDENNRYAPRDWCPHPALVIQLALEMELPSLLPAALYDLSRYGPSKIMAGISIPCTLYERILNRWPDSSKAADRTLKLSREMLTQVLRGREATQRFMANFIAKELHNRPPCSDCLHQNDKECSSRACHESFYFVMLNVLRSVGGIACGRDADPLFTLVQATEMLSRTDFSDGQRQCALRLCQPCKSDFALCASRAREDVWKQLPLWFSLAGDDGQTSFLDLN